MFIHLDKESSDTVRALSQKMGLTHKRVVKMAIGDSGAFFLGRPEAYVTIEKSKWHAMFGKVRAEIKRLAREHDEREKHIIEISRN